jgi:hypothetical protein
MRFLRDNLFYVALVAGVLVVGGAITAAGFRFSGIAAERQQTREKRAKEVVAAAGAPLVNEAVLKSTVEEVRLAQERASQITSACIERNRGSFEILELPLYLDGKLIGQQKAFPIDEELYNDRGLRYHFTSKYLETLEEMLSGLNAVEPPSDDEINEAILRATARIQDRLRMEKRKLELATGEGDAATGGRPRTPTVPGGMGMPPGMDGPTMPGMGMGGMPGGYPGARMPGMGRGGMGTDAAAGEQARQEGFLAAKLYRASRGPIYASLDSLDVVFPIREPAAPDTQLWEAQLNLWITADVLAAIQETIADGLKDANGTALPATVPNSPVKRLVQLDVIEDYVTKGSTGTTGGAPMGGGGAPGGMGGMPMMPGGGGMPMPMPGMGGMPPGMGGMGGMPGMGMPGGGGGASASVTAGAATNLTARATEPRYEVKHYRLTVILNSQDLPKLLTKLLSRNYHTILDVAFDAVPVDTQDPYYYGTDPVVQVTIVGELLFLSDWTRGTMVQGADGKSTWSEELPPLMPEAVLRGLEQANALRDEDKKRLAKR